MKSRFFAPVIVAVVSFLGFLGINLLAPQSIVSDSQTHYLIKPVQVGQVLYVQPRLSLGNLAPESLWASLEEVAQQYYIKDAKLHVKQVNGRGIPGLIVFTDSLESIAEPAASDLVATAN